jgi:hypothetical protein
VWEREREGEPEKGRVGERREEKRITNEENIRGGKWYIFAEKVWEKESTKVPLHEEKGWFEYLIVLRFENKRCYCCVNGNIAFVECWADWI